MPQLSMLPQQRSTELNAPALDTILRMKTWVLMQTIRPKRIKKQREVNLSQITIKRIPV